MKTINTKLVVSLIAAVLMTACGDSDGNNNNNRTYQGNDFSNTIQASSTNGDSIDLDLYAQDFRNSNNNNFNGFNQNLNSSVRGTLRVTADPNDISGINGKACSVDGFNLTGFMPAGNYDVRTTTEGSYNPSPSSDLFSNIQISITSRSNFGGSRVRLSGTLVGANVSPRNFSNSNLSTLGVPHGAHIIVEGGCQFFFQL